MYRRLSLVRLPSKNRVLLLTCDETLRDLVNKALSRYLRCEVYQARNMEQLLGYPRLREFDLLIIDIQACRLRWQDFIAQVRNAAGQIRLLVLVDESSLGVVQPIEEHQPLHVMLRPTKPTSLVETVAGLFLTDLEVAVL